MQLHYDTAFENMSLEDIKKWCEINYSTLVGSAIFTSNTSFISKVISWAEQWGLKEKECFVPSHTGSIVLKDGSLYIFDMKPPFGKAQRLDDYIYKTKDRFAVILRNFKLNPVMFSSNILEWEGKKYPFMSAIRSVFSKRNSKWARHCSELHLRELQKQGLFMDTNPEITPFQLFYLLLGYEENDR